MFSRYARRGDLNDDITCNSPNSNCMGAYDIIVGGLLVIPGFRLLRFLTTPLLRSIGYYRYYSPLFFLQRIGRNDYDIHLGTAWDVLLQKRLSQRSMLRNAADGLLGVLQAYKEGKLAATAKLHATMYFLSASTLQQLGFKTRKPQWYELVSFLASYPEVFLLQWLCCGYPRPLNLDKLVIIEANGQDILAQEQIVRRLVRALGNSRR